MITLTVYCVLVLGASLFGGFLPMLLRLTHRRMQIALSFVSGVMFGVALLHMVPHAWVEFVEAGQGRSLDAIMLWLVGGFMAMFLLERFFSFHQHEHGPQPAGDNGQHSHAHCDHPQHASNDHTHGQHHHPPAKKQSLGWSGAAIGLAVHSILCGVAMAAAVTAEIHHGHTGYLLGFGTFLVVFLHKPFDALTIGTLMAAGNKSSRLRHVVNALFAMCVPVGAALFLLGITAVEGGAHVIIGAALAFSAGMFLCIALSDLLPELQFHQHDRIQLTAALITGLALAWVVGIFEGDLHEQHDHADHRHESRSMVDRHDHGHDHVHGDDCDHDHDHDHDEDHDHDHN